MLGIEFLNEFIQHTDIYTSATDLVEKKEPVNGSWECWTAFMLLQSGDGNAYGSLKNLLNS